MRPNHANDGTHINLVNRKLKPTSLIIGWMNAYGLTRSHGGRIVVPRKHSVNALQLCFILKSISPNPDAVVDLLNTQMRS